MFLTYETTGNNVRKKFFTQFSFIKIHISLEVNIKLQTRKKVIKNLTYSRFYVSQHLLYVKAKRKNRKHYNNILILWYT